MKDRACAAARRRSSQRTERDDSGDAARFRQGRGLSAHILPASATMVGVCMTVLSIGRLGPSGEWRMLIDKLLAVDALVFLTSALLSFMSMRWRGTDSLYESRAEVVFIIGLGLLALGAVALAFTIV